jgi:hypothetical protein
MIENEAVAVLLGQRFRCRKNVIKQHVELDLLRVHGELASLIFARSRISLMSCSSRRLARRMRDSGSRSTLCCPSAAASSSSISAIPIIAFNGVRSSWLIEARKSDLARLASSARSLAIRSSASASLRRVRSE